MLALLSQFAHLQNGTEKDLLPSLPSAGDGTTLLSRLPEVATMPRVFGPDHKGRVSASGTVIFLGPQGPPFASHQKDDKSQH